MEKLRVWWITNPPEDPQYIPVEDVQDAATLLAAKANSEVDNPFIYANAGGLEVFEDGKWTEWYSEDGDDIDAWMEANGWY